jgi:type VI secretion system lysozyme-like protein
VRYGDENEAGLTVLDRLLLQPERADAMGLQGDPLLTSIARDLQILMNSRRADEPIPDEYPEVMNSILNFGMPALGRYGDIGLATERNRLCRSMEDAVRTFEPRLRRAQVRVLEQDSQHKTVVRFLLEANVEGLGMRQIFEMRLKPETGEMTVAAGDGA